MSGGNGAIVDDIKNRTLKRILEENPNLLRTSWNGDKDHNFPSNPLTCSKFGGGNPYFSKEKVWPACEECSKDKTFVCQINLKEIPKDVQLHIGLQKGLFQLFYCFECSPFEDVFNDVGIIPDNQIDLPSLKLLAGAAHCRTSLKAENIPGSVKRFIAEIKEGGSTSQEYPEHFVCWEQNSFKEIMICEEFCNKFEDTLNTEEKEEIYKFYTDEDTESIKIAHPGIKLGGYIRWVQGVEYPTCPTCNITMDTTFLQIESDELFLNSWGDLGTAHVTLCPNCKKAGLGWACS